VAAAIDSEQILAFDPQGDMWVVTDLPRVFEYQISAP
jgi:hypothetical protein